MKRTFLILFLLFNILFVNAQTNAVTDTGDEVILYTDGTWKYLDSNTAAGKEIKLNTKKFTKSTSSTFLLKSNIIDIGFWLNPKKWSFTKTVDNNDAEYELEYKAGDLYGMIITERMEIPLVTLRSIAIENGLSSAPDLTIVQEEYRMVNGLKVLHLQMDGTMEGIKFSYYGYYFSNASGTIQFVTYTSQSLMNEFKPISDDLLNGMVEIN